jgi:hypothetical protein
MRRSALLVTLVVASLLVPFTAGTALASHSATDWDGDGTANAVDNCPVDYNRPLNNSPQEWLDWDKDGQGDVCDPTPFTPLAGYTHYQIDWYFLDANQEPDPGPACSTYLDVMDGQPSTPDHQCLNNGDTDQITYVIQGSTSVSWTIQCDAGGSVSGTVEHTDKVIVLPLTRTCQISGTHLYGGADDGPLSRYAPLVYLAPGEQNLPMDPGTFVAKSALKWAHDTGCDDHTVVNEGKVSASKLGSGGYQHQQSYRSGVLQRCKDSGTYYKSNWYTRPHDDSPFKVNDQKDEGFYLDFADASRGGGPFPPRIYYSYSPHHYITYWLFYGFNRPPVGLIGEVDEHEGDWERISVRLDQNDNATEVAYYQHDCPPEIYTWADMQVNGYLNGLHPIVFAANGTHASYPDLGDHTGKPCPEASVPALDTVGRGQLWMTWQSVSDVAVQSWFGFGGAWGHNGTLSSTTGPLGPAYKSPAPNGW